MSRHSGRPRSLEEWWKVEDRGYTTPCWIWIGFISAQGYGQYRLTNRKTVRAHRHVYEMRKDKIPDGMQLDHLCKVTACVNPEHMDVVTNRENTLRGNCWWKQNTRRKHVTT